MWVLRIEYLLLKWQHLAMLDCHKGTVYNIRLMNLLFLELSEHS